MFNVKARLGAQGWMRPMITGKRLDGKWRALKCRCVHGQWSLFCPTPGKMGVTEPDGFRKSESGGETATTQSRNIWVGCAGRRVSVRPPSSRGPAEQAGTYVCQDGPEGQGELSNLKGRSYGDRNDIGMCRCPNPSPLTPQPKGEVRETTGWLRVFPPWRGIRT